jgi:hypothetical protein
MNKEARLDEKRTVEFSNSAQDQRAKRPASDEVNPDRTRCKYQVTRNSQLSALGLTFRICEMYEMHEEFAPQCGHFSSEAVAGAWLSPDNRIFSRFLIWLAICVRLEKTDPGDIRRTPGVP